MTTNTKRKEIKRDELIIKKNEVLEASYQIMRSCFVCNFGYNVGEVITHSKVLEILKNKGMVQNFINSGDLKLLQYVDNQKPSR